MRPHLRALAAKQGGAFTRQQARDAGYTPAEIRARTSPRGPWVVVHHGVYAEREVWEALDVHDGQWRVRDWAAHLVIQTPHVMSHDSGARAHRLDLLRPARPLVHVTRAEKRGSRLKAEVLHHVSRVSRPQVTTAGGLPVTDVPRTVVDLARWHGITAGVVAGDSALRLGADKAAMIRGLAGMTHFPGVGDARAALALLDEGAESVGESLLRLLVLELGIGEPSTQFAVRVEGGAVFWCDIRVGCHLFEFDGLVKVLPVAAGGVAEVPAHEVVWREKKRERLICAQNLGMSRVIWEDLWGEQRRLARARLKAEYEVTRQRYGDHPPEHLLRFAAEMRSRRIARRRRDAG